MVSKGILTRQNITKKSLQVFSVKGYFNTSISDILEATGLTKGGLYGHFASKEDIWYAVYDEAVKIWRSIVFKDINNITNPLERIEITIEYHLANYLGEDVFDGGCFFVNMLVEISGQSEQMSKHILRGFVQFSRLLRTWLEDADDKGLLKEGLNYREISNFIIISLNGAATLYSASKDTSIWKETITQMRFYIDQLKG
ncbi:MAG: TetR/AcrR family transcriptional regulator [Deltaproteobacteria bacterium]|nr:TetR/AcrR family transcriptional regulator [Deltaproteobacteria bacterium]